MTYEQARDYTEGLRQRGIKPGLDGISRLLEAVENPQNSLRIVHIAGTNGKGSAGAFLESILMCGKKNVCRFVSPAVGEYLEEFTNNSSPVSRELYAEAVAVTAAAAEKDNILPTSFEAETAAAFLMFKKLAPDYAIIECGMGGALDATNVIDSPAAVMITSISLDHTAFLGDTISDIAKHKAGIIKDGTTVITAPQQPDAERVIRRAARQRNALLHIAQDIKKTVYYLDKTEFEFEDEKYTIRLLGAFQPQNAALAIKTAKALGISAPIIKKGLRRAEWQYRFERIGKFILDGAHNPDAARALAKSLELYVESKKTAFICGCFSDKDFNEIARITAPYAAAVHCIKPPGGRGLDADILRQAFARFGTDAFAFKTMQEAMAAAAGYDTIVIFGSLSILSEARELIIRPGEHNGKSK